jgi:putative hydrolase of HD superfamily
VGTTSTDRLARQIAFLLEAGTLKSILRRTSLIDGSRRENSAEHSWHLALAAVFTREHVPFAFDLARVLEMLTIHDLVEIDAGDTFAYDVAGLATKAAREEAAADRLFGLLPADQSAHLRALWDEFEAAGTPEARVAHAMDRLQPFLVNANANGGTWREHQLTRAQIMARMAPIELTLPDVWPVVVRVIDACCAAGLIRSGP